MVPIRSQAATKHERALKFAPLLLLLPAGAFVGLLIHARSIIVRPEISIHEAVWQRDLEAVKAHLATGTPVDELNEVGQTALFTAISSRRRDEFVDYLLKMGASPNAETSGRQTPLHGAARSGDLLLVRRLLDLGAEVNAPTSGKRTPLHSAADGRNEEVVRELLKKGANPKSAAADGTTPLHIAAEEGQLRTVEVLLSRGALIDARGQEGRTPLFAAIARKRSAISMRLIEQGANPNLAQRDGTTCLHVASARGDDELIGALIEHGATINSIGPRKRTPLHSAASWNRYEAVKELLAHGANPNARGPGGSVPLAGALLYANDERIAKLLITRTRDLRTLTDDGSTLLHFAVAGGKSSVVVRTLMDHGVDPWHKNEHKESAIDLARARNKREILTLLEAAPPSKE